MVHIRQQWNGKFSQATFFARGVSPRVVCEVGIHRACYDLCVYLAELLQSVIEGQNFRRAYKSAIILKREKVEHFAL